jgi:hypothetical protein
MRVVNRTIVYVDGFNLYFGALRDTPHRWLDLVRLSELLLPSDTVVAVRYFTARLNARGLEDTKRRRQDVYLRALRTCPEITIEFGHFLSHPVRMLVASPDPDERQFVRVVRTEEKGSDVNLATALVSDAYEERFETAVVISNDSDLLAPIRLVRTRLQRPVGILCPHRIPSTVLRSIASFVKPIRPGVLKESQFPAVLRDARGQFRRPETW